MTYQVEKAFNGTLRTFWTDQSASGWTDYRRQLEELRGKPFDGPMDWPELCRAQGAFECGIMPQAHFAGEQASVAAEVALWDSLNG